MKGILGIVFFVRVICLAQTVKGQFKLTQLDEDALYAQPINGHAKEIVEYVFEGKFFESKSNDTIIDTSAQQKKIIRRFDEKGNEIEHFEYIKSRLTYMITFNYLNDSTVITNTYDSNKNLIEKITYKYDTKGREVASYPEIEADPNAKYNWVPQKIVYKYDSNDNLVLKIKCYSDKTLEKTNINYNNDHQKTERNVMISGVNFKTIYQYDSLKKLIKMEYYLAGNLTHTIALIYNSFDSKRNWLSVRYVNVTNGRWNSVSQPVLYKRDITYY